MADHLSGPIADSRLALGGERSRAGDWPTLHLAAPLPALDALISDPG